MTFKGRESKGLHQGARNWSQLLLECW